MLSLARCAATYAPPSAAAGNARVLFNSYAFLLAFLPATLLAVRLLSVAGGNRAVVVGLTLLSLLFYGWWNAVYLLLLVPLMLANFWLATVLVRQRRAYGRAHRPLFVAGLALNLATLGYFKYANFFVDTVNAVTGAGWVVGTVVLPLGISFFIFQKLAFLVDAWEGRLDEHLDLADYCLFVTFFPQLIAGPIVHHSEVLPQFRELGRGTRVPVAQAVTIFALGLAKKVLLADAAAPIAAAVFARTHAHPGLLEAWLGSLAYTVQLYFDFSGYTDMAIGAALLFGVRLPVNFASPYKATSIIDFWRRWHITLSRFLRDYLYIPLGGNRRGEARRQANLFLTMLLGGLWHGAGWTFVIWGGLHGVYLAVNHAWRALPSSAPRTTSQATTLASGLLTFVAVVVAWVFFRAPNVSTALEMLRAMAGGNGVGDLHLLATADIAVVVALLALAWLAPNTQELTAYEGPHGAYDAHARPGVKTTSGFAWTPSPRWALATGVLLAVSVMSLSRVSEFLYFQF